MDFHIVESDTCILLCSVLCGLFNLLLVNVSCELFSTILVKQIKDSFTVNKFNV